MWVGGILLFLIIGLITIIQLILNRKWELIYTAYGYEDYFKFISKLKEEGVKYKVELPVNARSDRFNDNTQYYIYVKKK